MAQTVTGTVRDSAARALPGVDVLIEGSSITTTTDATGRFLLSGVPLGAQVVLFRLVGFRPVRTRVYLVTGDTTKADAVMIPEAIRKPDATQQLDSLVVTATTPSPRGIGREAFEERRKMGFGKFIDSGTLRRAELRRTSDVLRGIPGVNMVRFRECQGPSRCGPVEERAAGGRGGATSMMPRTNQEYCWMSVVLDGNILYHSGSASPPPDFSRDFRPPELEAIEVYRSSAESPTEYSGSAAQCGVILLWTKRGIR
jgi:hypothetical protein